MRFEEAWIPCLAIVLVLASCVSLVSGSFAPAIFQATLKPGESVSETVSVSLSAVAPQESKVDVVFSFDLSDSMNYYFAAAKSHASSIMTALQQSHVDAAFGVMSHMDYPHTYSSYGYGAAYGDARYGDYAYRHDQSVTSNTSAVSDATHRLTLGCGSYEDPEDYERIMYESYADPSVGWRPGAKRFLIMLCDSIPHDDNLNEGVPRKTYNWSTGGDPGRDEVMFTSDDLDLQTVLGQMATNHVVLLVIRYGYLVVATAPYWQHWASLTGGETYTSSNVNSILSKILSLPEEHGSRVAKLVLKAQTGYELWLTSTSPPQYANIDVPEEGITKTFNLTITAPNNTLPGTYKFKINADADNLNAGEQEVTITIVQPEPVVPPVPPPEPEPESPPFRYEPAMILLGSLATFGVVASLFLFALLMWKIRRRKRRAKSPSTLRLVARR